MKQAIFGHRQDQSANIRRLQKLGFASQGEQTLGHILSRINSEGLVEKYAVTPLGTVLRYLPYKPNNFEAQSLPSDSEERETRRNRPKRRKI